MTQRRMYLDEYPYFVTFRTRVDLRLFEDEEYAELLAKIMFNAGRLKQYDILAYQIMPTHVHLLVFHNNNSTAPTERRVRGIYKPNPTRDSAPAVGNENYTISQFMYTVKSYFAKVLRVKYGIPYSIL